MDNNQLYYLYLQELARQQEEDRGNSWSNAKHYADKIGNYGNNLSLVGDTIKNNVNSKVAQKIGNGMSKVGGTLQNGASSVNNVLNAPQNYFKGFAGQGLQNVGANLASHGGALGTIGNGISNLGSTIAGTTGTTAGTMGSSSALSGAISNAAPSATSIAGGTAAGTTAGTAAGTTTAGIGAGGAAAGGAAGGAAAGGAAGGSAAGGAAAAGPIGALIALCIMALAGTNRKRAKKMGNSLRESSEQMSEQGNEEADQRLAQTKQNSANMIAQDYTQPVISGGAAPIETQLSPVQEYQNYLKYLGYPDEIINGVPQGLNGGNKDIDNWIKQYNAGTGKDNPINIPQTEEEVAAAKAGTFNTPTMNAAASQQENIKRGLLDKFVSGISDFSKGYDENRNRAFAPDNLKAKTFNEDGKEVTKGKMARLGEAMGTVGRMVNKPGVQALLAGGISTALTGNPLYGVGMAAKYGGNRAMSNIYQDALAKQGVETDPGMFGSLTSHDMDALMKPQYKAVEQQMANELLQERIRHNQEMEDHYKMMEAIRQQDADTRKYKATNGTTVTHVSSGGGKSGGKGGKSTGGKPQQHKDWNSDLAGFVQIMTDPRYKDKTDLARGRFIQKYGVDPMGYIKKGK